MHIASTLPGRRICILLVHCTMNLILQPIAVISCKCVGVTNFFLTNTAKIRLTLPTFLQHLSQLFLALDEYTVNTDISTHLLTNKPSHSTLQSHQHLVQGVTESHLHSVSHHLSTFTCMSYCYFHVWYRPFIYTYETSLLLQIWCRTFVHTYLNQILLYSSGTSCSTLLQSKQIMPVTDLYLHIFTVP